MPQINQLFVFLANMPTSVSLPSRVGVGATEHVRTCPSMNAHNHFASCQVNKRLTLSGETQDTHAVKSGSVCKHRAGL
jgi:hypothetical protein